MVNAFQIGNISTNTPVVLAPMAGVTNAPFRRLCREFAAQAVKDLGARGVPSVEPVETTATTDGRGDAVVSFAPNDGTPTGSQFVKPSVEEDGTSVSPHRFAGADRVRTPPRPPIDLGLYVAEMVTSRAVVERNPRAMRIINCDPDESPRSVQVYGVDPKTVGAAVAIIAGEDRADHIDLNFGCPVPKVTRKGGGGALPWKTSLFAAILNAAVTAAAPFQIPVTVKMRIGIDDEHETYLDAGRIAANEGISALTLHARTVAERYSGNAHWDNISILKNEITGIPVLGNGDIFSGGDALEMLAQTGCDGVVVGRGCLGRPWLFYDLVTALHSPSPSVEEPKASRNHRLSPPVSRGFDSAQPTATYTPSVEPSRNHGNITTATYKPSLREVSDVIVRHAELLTDYFSDEALACRDMRKHIAWYLRGFPVGGETRRELALIKDITELEDRLAKLPDEPYPTAADGPRGRAGSAKRPHLPYGWLDSRDLNDAQACQLTEEESDTDGG